MTESCNRFVLRTYLPEFIALVGESRWRKRIDALRNEGHRSAALERIVSDFHWIELTLDDEANLRAVEGLEISPTVDAAALAQVLRALRFSRNVVVFSTRLNAVGQNVIKGRLRDALKSGTGFSPLAQEFEFASLGEIAGLVTRFPDLSGLGRQDVSFGSARGQWYAECKFLSADAGRKITRRDFYRLCALVEEDLRKAGERDRDVVIVTLNNRLEAGVHLHGGLSVAISRFCSGLKEDSRQEGFTIHWDGLDGVSGEYGSASFYRQLQDRFGISAHVFGTVGKDGRCKLLVVRSEQVDDASKPILDALRDAAKQLPSDADGVICLHIQGISSEDLLKQHVQEHFLLLTNYFFFFQPQLHVASVHVAPAGELSTSEDASTYYALSFINPTHGSDVEGSMFGTFLEGERVRLVSKPWVMLSS